MRTFTDNPSEVRIYNAGLLQCRNSVIATIVIPGLGSGISHVANPVLSFTHEMCFLNVF